MKKITIILTTISLFSLINADTPSEKKDLVTTVITQAITRGSILTSNNVGQFDSYIKNSNKPIIVKFYAPSCPSCRTINKHFVALSQQYANKATFVSVNTAQRAHRGLLNRYNIRRIPTFMFFKEGKVHHKILGPSAGQLKSLVTNFVK